MTQVTGEVTEEAAPPGPAPEALQLLLPDLCQALAALPRLAQLPLPLLHGRGSVALSPLSQLADLSPQRLGVVPPCPLPALLLLPLPCQLLLVATAGTGDTGTLWHRHGDTATVPW